jgi:GT2 family glycosyltransferase
MCQRFAERAGEFVSKISIIIPHMNQLDFLERCLTSLAPQVAKYPGTEAVIVDNGSTVLPTDIVKKHAWARLDHEKTKGPGPARNKGIAVSDGEIMAFIDADCLAHPGWLDSIVQAFKNNPDVDILGGEVLIAYVDEKRLTVIEAYEAIFGYRQQDYIERQHFSGTGNLAMKRPVFAKVGPFAGIGIAEDRDWGHRAYQAGFKTIFVPNMIVYHPARKTFPELCVKWDRHITHDYNERAQGFVGHVKWVILTFAVAVSGFVDIPRRVIFSPYLKGVWNKIMASAMLVRIRLYRAEKMLRIMFRQDAADPKWNR